MEQRDLSLDRCGPERLVGGAFDASQTQDAVAIAGSVVVAGRLRRVFDVVGASVWAAPRVDPDGAAPHDERDHGN